MAFLPRKYQRKGKAKVNLHRNIAVLLEILGKQKLCKVSIDIPAMPNS